MYNGNMYQSFIKGKEEEGNRGWEIPDRSSSKVTPADSFPLFLRLPFELRRMIYLFASPPRFVHIREETEDWDDFRERVRTTPLQLQLHPSLAYFARHWRGRLSSRQDQPPLEAYGFGGPASSSSSTRPRHMSWAPTDEAPLIPHHIVAENTAYAWAFAREGTLWSAAPVPAFLHVSHESRHVLMRSGYEFAFPTRTRGARTWFNFRTDVLYLGLFREDEDDATGDGNNMTAQMLLSGNGCWDVGQFDPADLKRVRRLALDAPANMMMFERTRVVDALACVVGLMPGVETVFLDEGMRDSVLAQSDGPARPDGDRRWVFTAPLEVDALALNFASERLVASTGYGNRFLQQHKLENMGDGSEFFAEAARAMRSELAARMRSREAGSSSSSSFSPAQPKVPEVCLAHIGPRWMCDNLCVWRRKAWDKQQYYQEREARAAAWEEAKRSIDVPRRHLYEHEEGGPPSPFTERYRYDAEAFDEAFVDLGELYGYYYPESEAGNHGEWLLGETIAALDHRAAAHLK